MRRMIELWLLSGALAASTGVNIYHATSTVETPAGCPKCDTMAALQAEPDAILVKTIDLTSAQKQKLSSCCPTYVVSRNEISGRIEMLAEDLGQELCKKDPQQERICLLADEIGKARADEIKKQTSNVLLVKEMLTPQQLERLIQTCNQK